MPSPAPMDTNDGEERSMDGPKKPPLTLGRFLIGVIIVLAAIPALRAWNKSDFCRGWSEHYAQRAVALRTDALNPQLSPQEVKELRVAADWHEVVSAKYAAVAARPWRAYYPLVNSTEQLAIASKY